MKLSHLDIKINKEEFEELFGKSAFMEVYGQGKDLEAIQDMKWEEMDGKQRALASANAWICLHRFVHIFLESHLAGLMSSEKRRVWIKYL